MIREQDPLKQGLKLHVQLYHSDNHNNSRARSTKTRIETLQYCTYSSINYDIREQDPLKQGLKL